MLYLCSDDVTAVISVGLRNTAYGEVVGFGPARHEDYLGSRRADERSDLATRTLDRSLRPLAELLDRRRVAPFSGKKRQHRLHNIGGDLRRSAVI
jgi:hypothetical protein